MRQRTSKDGGERVARELIEQARVDTCDDYRDIFLRERGVCEGARVFTSQVGVGHDEEERSKTKTECEGVHEIEGRDRWVVCGLVILACRVGSTSSANTCGAYRVLVTTHVRRSMECAYSRISENYFKVQKTTGPGFEPGTIPIRAGRSTTELPCQ